MTTEARNEGGVAAQQPAAANVEQKQEQGASLVGGVRTTVSEAVDRAKHMFDHREAKDEQAGQEAGQAAREGTGQVAESTRSTLAAARQQLAAGAVYVKEAAAQAAGKVRETAAQAGGATQEGAGQAAEGVKGVAANITDRGKTAAMEASAAVQERAGPAVDAARQRASDAGAWLRTHRAEVAGAVAALPAAWLALKWGLPLLFRALWWLLRSWLPTWVAAVAVVAVGIAFAGPGAYAQSHRQLTEQGRRPAGRTQDEGASDQARGKGMQQGNARRGIDREPMEE